MWSVLRAWQSVAGLCYWFLWLLSLIPWMWIMVCFTVFVYRRRTQCSGRYSDWSSRSGRWAVQPRNRAGYQWQERYQILLIQCGVGVNFVSQRPDQSRPCLDVITMALVLLVPPMISLMLSPTSVNSEVISSVGVCLIQTFCPMSGTKRKSERSDSQDLKRLRPSSRQASTRSSSSNKRASGPPLSSSSKKASSSPRGRHAGATNTGYCHEYYEERKGRRGAREVTRSRGGEDLRRRESQRGLEGLSQVWC